MPYSPSHPSTGEPIHTIGEHNEAAAELAGRYLPPGVAPGQTEPPMSVPQELTARAERMRARVHEDTETAAAALAVEREDPYTSLGGGRATYHALGELPVAAEGTPAAREVTRGRGGRLVTRVTLGDRFRDVPVIESDPQNDAAIQAAEEALRRGRGTPVNRLPGKTSK